MKATGSAKLGEVEHIGLPPAHQASLVLGDGIVLANGPAQAAVSPETLADAYGVKARVERCSQGTLMVIVDGRLSSQMTYR